MPERNSVTFPTLARSRVFLGSRFGTRSGFFRILFGSTTFDKLFLFLVQPNDDPDCCATLDVEPCVIAQVGFSNR